MHLRSGNYYYSLGESQKQKPKKNEKQNNEGEASNSTFFWFVFWFLICIIFLLLLEIIALNEEIDTLLKKNKSMRRESIVHLLYTVFNAIYG